MKFNNGAQICAADGKRLGELGRVVLNPHTWEVTDIVVHKGYFFSTDKVIPVGDIQQTLEDRVTLVESANDYMYPDYAETEFIPLTGDEQASADMPSPVLWYPPFGMMVYNSMDTQAPYIVHETNHIPPGTQALAIGSRVVTADGHHAGHVQEVFMESAANLASHILVSKGLLLPGEKLVPTHWIEKIEDGEIHLAVGEAMLMSLPDYNRR